ncbi:MAG: LCP family protein, partial [Oscillospiraceae bacterium]|nr:LCP family protein [Oscillospiraceae bacterium]
MGEYLKGRRRRVSNLSIRRALFVVGVFLLCLVVFTAIAAAVFVAGNMRTGKAELVGKDLPPDPLHILLIGVAEKPEGAAFAVVGFDFAAEKIEVTALPFESLCKADGREDTLGGHLRYGSTISAVEAAGEFLNIKIDRYAKVNLGKFETVIDKLDGLGYDLAGSLFYRDESGTVLVSIEPGNQRLAGAE